MTKRALLKPGAIGESFLKANSLTDFPCCHPSHPIR
jgi:hypothetical protein